MTLFKNKYRIESIRLPGYDYSQPGGYFITIVTHNRQCLFGNIVDGKMILNEYGELVKNEWLKTGVIRPNIIIDAFVVMPNHLHGILIITDNYDCGGTLQRASTTIRETHKKFNSDHCTVVQIDHHKTNQPIAWRRGDTLQRGFMCLHANATIVATKLLRTHHPG